MTCNRLILIAAAALAVLSQQVRGQLMVIDEPVINAYTAITSILASDDNDVDTVTVAGTTGFSEGDTVMVYVVKGAWIRTSGPVPPEQIGSDAQVATSCGRYSFLIIDQIIGNQVVLNNTLRPEIGPLGPGEVAQLIRVPSYRRARVDSELTAPDWNPVSGTGGVVAMFVQRSLTLNADIDVTGKGFLGASETADFTGGACTVEDTVAYDSMFYDINNPVIRAGKKGEGTTRADFTLLRGKARNINGGGGGNGRFSGGGGGSNYNSGGTGGYESSLCSAGVDAWGIGGYSLYSSGYYRNDAIGSGRAFFGGGGGAGTRITGRNTSGGGDGGGLVIIIADSIISNGNRILADGASVSGVATGAGGGGGGGGGIVLAVNHYGDQLNLSACGGKGGDTYVAGDTTGPGGGGGGGFYWLSGNPGPGEVSTSLLNGAAGRYLSGNNPTYGALPGGTPGRINNLQVPIRGFIFNPVPDGTTVCSDEDPGILASSRPRGGDGTYTYRWLDSTRVHSWQPAPGVNNQQNYDFPGPLSDTTWFRRVVDDGILPPDTSFRVAYYVHPRINNNLVTAPDTVCAGNAPENPFVPSAVLSGGLGPGTYNYQWIRKPLAGDWSAIGGATGGSYQASPLTTTTEFARFVTSGVCEDTSAALRVQVWQQLTGNQVTPFDTICYNTVPDQISGPVPGQGDPADRRYRWQASADTVSGWSVVGGNSTAYQPPALTQTTYYRRIVLSGSDDACIDTSNTVEVLNIPLITGNTITGTHTVCRDDQALPLEGSDPGGGYQGLYSYRWEARTASTGWGPAPGGNTVKSAYDAGIMDGDTTFFRRIVGSGGNARDVCTSTSNTETINVLPSISGNLITTSDAVKCQGDLLEEISQDVAQAPAPGGGAMVGGNDPTRIYRWEEASGQGTPGTWQELTGETSMNYTVRPVLSQEDDRFFRRIIFSGQQQQCRDTSNLVRITVHTAITSNTIEPFDSVCFADTKLLSGSEPQGEDGLTPVYTWRDLDTGGDLPGSDQQQYTAGPYNTLGQYRYERIVRIGECTDTTNPMQITVMQLPGGMLTDQTYQACEQDTLFAIDLNMDRLNTYVAPWQVTLTNGVDPGEIGPFTVTGDGGLPVTLETVPDSILYTYQIASISYGSAQGRYTCTAPGDSISGAVPVWVYREPEPFITPADSVKVCDITVSLTGDPDHGVGTWSQVNTDLPAVTFSDPNSESTAVFIQDISERFGLYRLRYRSVAGDCHGDALIDVHFFEQPAPAFAGEDTMIFFINSLKLKADPPTAGIGTWEVVRGGGIIVDQNDPDTWVYELPLGEENRFRWTVTNGEDEGTCTTTSDVVIVIRNEVKRYDGFSPNGDPVNEYFIMQGLKYADRFSISFFNALGNTVRTIASETLEELEVDEALIAGGLKEDEMVVWDGRAGNGNLVPSGTYYYVVTFSIDQREPGSGTIYRTDDYKRTGYVVVNRD